MYITNEQDIAAISKIILEKKFFRYRGKDVSGECDLFERDFASHLGVSHAVMVTSGTNALITSLKVLGIGPGDEVLVPTFTFFATIASVISVGAIPILINVDEKLSISAAEILQRITSKTKAIIPVHMDGRPCDMTAISGIAASHNLIIIEDVAQAIGGSFKDKKLGAWGSAGAFSFNVDKIISCGEGGAVTFNSREQFEKGLCLQDTNCQFGPTHKDSFTTASPFIGDSMRVSELSGALMRVQLGRLEFILSELRSRSNVIKKVLKDGGIVINESHDDNGDCGTSVYMQFQNIEQCKQAAVGLASENVIAIPISARPAHAFWQWIHLLKELRVQEHLKVHYQGLDTNKLYNKAFFLDSLDTLLRNLKINVDLSLSLDECSELAHKIVKVLKTIK